MVKIKVMGLIFLGTLSKNWWSRKIVMTDWFLPRKLWLKDPFPQNSILTHGMT